ncbi:hypothetical protein ONZ45_g7845 [Pleurotus djamor]|nr:hypothetical protein ONZ45_g7845 [Pleurotus djamor]
MFARQILMLIVSLSVALAHPLAFHKHEARESGSVAHVHKRDGHLAFQALLEGNQQFRAAIAASAEPTLLKKLTDDGQAPPFMFLGCSDSRVSEGTVFNAKPGTLFTQRNIANQFHHTDANTHSVLSYAVAELKVQHIIVMGHYGCGGVGAAIASPPKAPIDAANGAVQNWIAPIRQIFATSTRPEIVELRERIKGRTDVEEPEPQEPGFRALVEENVRAGVHSIFADSVMANHFAALASAGNSTEGIKERSVEGPLVDVFVHGLVYDIENGEVHDLGVSMGPPGKAVPELPFPKLNITAPVSIHNAAANVHVASPATTTVTSSSSESSHAAREACISNCKAKRGLFNRML